MTAPVWTLLCLSLLAVSKPCLGQSLAALTARPTASTVTGMEVLRMLRGREFERLDRALIALQEETERDIRQESMMARVMSAFGSPNPAITPLVEEWVKARPGYPARLARAQHYMVLAWQARGSGWSNQTSATQREAMGLHLARTVLDAEAALGLNPRLTHAVALLIASAKGTGGAKDCVLTFQRFYERVGASFVVRFELAKCLLPRWGGSYQALEALAEEASDMEAANPRLSVLRGVVSWDRGTLIEDGNDREALRLYTDAIGHGDHSLFRLARARIHLDGRRYGDAMADIERALAFSPEDTEALILRAWTRNEMGRPAEAAADVRVVTELDPLDAFLVDFRDGEVEQAVATARRRNADGDAPGAIARLSSAIALVGEDAEALYWRGRVKLGAKDSGGALTDLQRAVQLDPYHLDALLGVDSILIGRGEYKTAVEYWTTYLVLEPSNGVALLARAKAHIGRGDVKPGGVDATAACAAGQQEGCWLAAALK